MEEITYKYVECDQCKIGGYDYCPKCFGGGGYSMPQSLDSIVPFEAKKSKLEKVKERLILVERADTNYNEKIDKYLNDVFATLISDGKATEGNKELIDQITRIKATKQAAFYIKKAKNELKVCDIASYRFVFSDNHFIQYRELPRRQADNTIISFDLKREVFNTYKGELQYKHDGRFQRINLEIFFKLIRSLMDKSVFCICLWRNDAQKFNAQEVVSRWNLADLMAYEIHTDFAKVYFIIEVKTYSEIQFDTIS
ncbi:hypothetical protein [Pseudocnuella soli]|uniref:hypothetical protein n=1 Tax=Pseudocnuella soli TaxID=2502779 RepID=UPI001049DFC2|nr:hypothetical protein [Pseudocnuella soli]